MNQNNLVAGRYRLIRKLGEGAMGVVWEAENMHTQRRVALKLVLHVNDHHCRRLLKEARACGRLSHRNIIDVLDVGETETHEPFLIMPLLSGETLAEFLTRKRRLNPVIAARIGYDMARALAAAHAAGIIHRDLKPANTFLHREPGLDEVVVKVLDFGVCKELDPKATVLTVEGKLIGTPAYMSPEQFNTRVPLDHRTDIWSLGVVLFEMLTGVKPFRGARLEEVIARIISGPIPTVAQLVRTVPAPLVSVVNRCLVRDREQRIGDAEELGGLLRAYLESDKASIPADRPSSASAAGPAGATPTPAIAQTIGITSFGTLTSVIGDAGDAEDECTITTPLRRPSPNPPRAHEPAGAGAPEHASYARVAERTILMDGQASGRRCVMPSQPDLMLDAAPGEERSRGAAPAVPERTTGWSLPARGAAILSRTILAFPRRTLFVISGASMLLAVMSFGLHVALRSYAQPGLKAIAAPLFEEVASRPLKAPDVIERAPIPPKPAELDVPAVPLAKEASRDAQRPTPTVKVPSPAPHNKVKAPLGSTAYGSKKQSPAPCGRLLRRCPQLNP